MNTYHVLDEDGEVVSVIMTEQTLKTGAATIAPVEVEAPQTEVAKVGS